MQQPFQLDTNRFSVVTEQSGKSPVILFMDDEESILDSFGKLLEMNGYIVYAARNGEQAIAAYSRTLSSKQRVDVAVIDLTIPDGMGGLETIARIREIDPCVRAIATTGHFQETLKEEYKKYGFAGFLPKPYLLKELLEAIDQVIGTERDNHE